MDEADQSEHHKTTGNEYYRLNAQSVVHRKSWYRTSRPSRLFYLREKNNFYDPTKLLWEGIVWLHRHLCKHCQTLHIQRPRNKYLDVRRAYLAYSKLRKRRKSQTRMITRRLLQLLEKFNTANR